jgi:hypothetical protein
MLCKWNALIRFAHLFTINSFLSTAGELRPKSRHVVGFSMHNRPPMTRREGACEFQLSNEVSDPPQGGTLLTPPARGPAVTEFKIGSPSELKRRGVTGI